MVRAVSIQGRGVQGLPTLDRARCRHSAALKHGKLAGEDIDDMDTKLEISEN
jgi:hypothetical protein